MPTTRLHRQYSSASIFIIRARVVPQFFKFFVFACSVADGSFVPCRAPSPLSTQISTQELLSKCQGAASCKTNRCATDWQIKQRFLKAWSCIGNPSQVILSQSIANVLVREHLSALHGDLCGDAASAGAYAVGTSIARLLISTTLPPTLILSHPAFHHLTQPSHHHS